MGNKGCYVIKILLTCMSALVRIHPSSRPANMLHGPFFIQPVTTQSRILATRAVNTFQIIAGKRESAGNQHFLLFPE